MIFKTKKRGMKISKLTVPLIKGNDLFAIIEGHVFMTNYKKGRVHVSNTNSPQNIKVYLCTLQSDTP